MDPNSLQPSPLDTLRHPANRNFNRRSLAVTSPPLRLVVVQHPSLPLSPGLVSATKLIVSTDLISPTGMKHWIGTGPDGRTPLQVSASRSTPSAYLLLPHTDVFIQRLLERA